MPRERREFILLPVQWDISVSLLLLPCQGMHRQSETLPSVTKDDVLLLVNSSWQALEVGHASCFSSRSEHGKHLATVATRVVNK